jgi:hypothetical protein
LALVASVALVGRSQSLNRDVDLGIDRLARILIDTL